MGRKSSFRRWRWGVEAVQGMICGLQQLRNEERAKHLGSSWGNSLVKNLGAHVAYRAHGCVHVEPSNGPLKTRPEQRDRRVSWRVN